MTEIYPSTVKINAGGKDVASVPVDEGLFKVPKEFKEKFEDEENVEEVYSEVVRNSNGIKVVKYAMYITQEDIERLNGLKDKLLAEEIDRLMLKMYNIISAQNHKENWAEVKEIEEGILTDEELKEEAREK